MTQQCDLSADDLKLSRIVGGYWANFARTGDPNNSTGGDSMASDVWPVFGSNQQRIVLDETPTLGTYN